MLYAVGTKVKFLHTGDVGTVAGLLEGNMLNVRLLDGMEIPAFIEDLQRLDGEEDPGRVKAKIVPGKQVKKPSAPIDLRARQQYSILKSYGLQLVFDPVLRTDGTTEKFELFLINDTKYDCLFTLTLSINGYVEERYNGKIDGETMFPVGEMLYDELNDAPEVEIECWRITTMGTGTRLHKILKIKAKQFFNSLKTAPILNKQVHLYRIFENLDDTDSLREKQEQEDLRSYTKRSAGLKPVQQGNLKRMGHEVEAMANFTTELDLHIEKLVSNSAKMKNAEIVRIQIAAFDQYLSQAIRLGVDRVFIIHGLGEGKLKDLIASRLIQMPEVTSFKNEFHPRYGYGATEVIFKED
ncbi:MAG: DUF2027 domain-containing protein [Saprospiraceae bacterium]|nr:DUF2027 domain-containing protein [Saprospiraceae bacterium]MCB9326557.1 DUF2027 domain-containing protein [Lewinellaceae bacterium]